jgi:hypothetical protein
MNFSDACEFNTIYILVKIVVWIDANTEKCNSLSLSSSMQKMTQISWIFLQS